jgi:hypothetical protein
VVELAVPAEPAAGKIDQREYSIANIPAAEGIEECMLEEGGTAVEEGEQSAAGRRPAAEEVLAPTPFVG